MSSTAGKCSQQLQQVQLGAVRDAVSMVTAYAGPHLPSCGQQSLHQLFQVQLQVLCTMSTSPVMTVQAQCQWPSVGNRCWRLPHQTTCCSCLLLQPSILGLAVDCMGFGAVAGRHLALVPQLQGVCKQW